MYKYQHPKPIVIKLTDELGFQLRQKAAEYIAANQIGLAQNEEVQRSKDLVHLQKWLYGTS